jgi:hypothetical protein
VSETDQAAGLRRWAEAQPASLPESTAENNHSPSRVLMTVGLPDGAHGDASLVERALERWREQGQRWVGDPASWRVVALDSHSPHLAVLAAQQSRWALWVGDDLDGFRRAYLTLKRINQQGGPSRLLLVHPPLPSRVGLLDNLQQAAAQFLGIELLVIGMPRRRVERL